MTKNHSQITLCECRAIKLRRKPEKTKDERETFKTIHKTGRGRDAAPTRKTETEGIVVITISFNDFDRFILRHPALRPCPVPPV